MLRFEILGSDQSVSRVVELENFPIRVGKLSASELCIDDASVSRMHSRIEKSGNVYRVVDLGSVGGTFVNQEKVMTHQLADGDILSFGKVSVRVTMHGEDAGNAPSLGAGAVSGAGFSALAFPPSAPSSVPGMPSRDMEKARPAAAMPPSAGGGFFTSSQQPKVIRKKKKEVSYERRFLSQRAKGEKGILEVAQLWRGDVISVDQYKAKAGNQISMGVSPKCNYRLDDKRIGTERTFLYCKDDGRWEMLFTQNMDGFVLVDPKYYGKERIPFKEASGAAFTVPTLPGIVDPGTKAIEISGETRAKFEFGEVTILVHFTDVVPLAVPPIFSMTQWNSFGGLIASFLIHFAIFSMVLFATDRVDALIVDRILTTSRFAEAIVQPEEEEEPEVEEPDEEEPPEEVEIDDSAADIAADTPFASNTASTGPALSKSESVAAAQQTGLLAQANVMSSMLSAGMAAQDFDSLDWSSFDSSAAAANAGYGLGMSGGGGGGSAMGGFGGGFGPGGGPGSGAIRAKARNVQTDLGSRKEKPPTMRAGNPDVTGSLDKRVIQRVVRQHSGELAACYQREVAKIKGLNGRIEVSWIIAVNGSVAKVFITSTTLNNKNVENCVLRSIKFWRFPSPKGGGMVQVNYPFVFELGSN